MHGRWRDGSEELSTRSTYGSISRQQGGMDMGPEVLPWLSLGLGVQQMGQSQRYADLASQGLNPAQQAQMRQAGTSNIGSNLAQRGLLDSSLYGGGLGQLEQYIAQSQNPMA